MRRPGFDSFWAFQISVGLADPLEDRGLGLITQSRLSQIRSSTTAIEEEVHKLLEVEFIGEEKYPT